MENTIDYEVGDIIIALFNMNNPLTIKAGQEFTAKGLKTICCNTLSVDIGLPWGADCAYCESCSSWLGKMPNAWFPANSFKKKQTIVERSTFTADELIEELEGISELVYP